jgi:hypothetical protein
MEVQNALLMIVKKQQVIHFIHIAKACFSAKSSAFALQVERIRSVLWRGDGIVLEIL